MVKRNHWSVDRSRKPNKNRRRNRERIPDVTTPFGSSFFERAVRPAAHPDSSRSLPPGLAKRDLPADLKSKLPKPPPGLERIIAGDDVVLLEKATGKILDVMEGVLKGGK